MTGMPYLSRRHARRVQHGAGELVRRLDPKELVEASRGCGSVRLPVRLQWDVDEEAPGIL